MYQSNRSSNIPSPGIWILENFCSNSPLPGPKSCSNAPTLGKITRELFSLFLQMQNKACVGLWFSTTPPWIRNLFLWIYQSLREISAAHNMKSRLAIKFPTPYEWWWNALLPGQEKASNARGMPGVGNVEASIWLYIIITSYYIILFYLPCKNKGHCSTCHRFTNPFTS